MASATITLKDKADANIVYTLVGQTDRGATYRNATRALGLPQSLSFSYNLGAPGALGNDRINITLRNSVQNGDTGLVSTGSVSIQLSIPRDSAWTTTDTEDLLIQLQDLFADANAEDIADGITP
jgi:hypothetical protein